MDEEDPAEVEHLAHCARMSPVDKSTQSKSKYRKRLCSQFAVMVTESMKSRRVTSVLPLLAASVDPRRLIGRRPEDGFEDGNILLEEDRRDGEVPLQLVRATAEVLRQAGHVLPLFDLVEKLNQAAGQEKV